MNYKYIYITLLFLVPFSFLFSQNNFPKDYFRSPVDYRIVLSGNFAELRSNHFHSGIDIKTNSKIGKRIYAIADAFVSRIKVSPYGYGLAIYLKHPNGYTSVYGHLYMFNDKIAEFVKQEQYKQKSFSVDIYPDSNQFVLKKGDLIAISGNSGHSYGPHIHFEIRDTKTEQPMNTLRFGLPVVDKVKPRFFHLMTYPLTKNNRFLPESKKKRYSVKGSYGKYYLSPSQIVKIGQKTGLGVRVHDFMDYSPNRVGVHRLELFLDDSLIYSHQLDHFSFDESRYINSHADYELKKTSNKWTQKCFVEQNNQLTIYKSLKNKGIIELDNFKIHQVRIVATDVNNNISSLSFKVQRSKAIPLAAPNLSERTVMPYNTENVFFKDGLNLKFPQGAFYDTIFFKYSLKKKLVNTYSPVYSVHNENVPVHKYYDISIQTVGLPKKMYSKAIIVKLSKTGHFSSNRTTVDSLGLVSAKLREFGNYSVVVDKNPPYLKPINIYTNKKLTVQETIEFKTSDNLSGIDTYNAFIDGEWVLLEYNYMKKKLIYKIDKSRLKKGKHTFELKLADAVGNETNYSVSFYY